MLLAEDDPSVRKLAANLLRDLGYTVLEAGNGNDALSVVRNHSGEEIRLLLTDAVMPQMSGTELAQQLRNVYPDIPVLFISGHFDVELDFTSQLGSGVSFLQKPFTPGELSRKVREALDQQDPSLAHTAARQGSTRADEFCRLD